MALANQGSYLFGEFQLNLDLRVLAREGERVSLGSKAYEVLACLVRRAGEIVTKAELFAAAWPESFVEEGALSQQIFYLRKALGDKAGYIDTVPGQGYRFMADVRYVAPNVTREATGGWGDIIQEAHERTHVMLEEPMPIPAAAGRSLSVRVLPLAGCVVALAGALAAWQWSSRVAPKDYQKVVVADFSNTTGDATFDRTLKKALEIDLDQSPYIDVLGESEGVNTLQMMGLKKDAVVTPAIAREICERNNRQVMLAGSLSKVGEAYLLAVEASDCSTGRRLASAKMQAAEKGKVLTALDAVADRVRAKLGESAKSISSYQVTIEQATTPSLEALKAYSMGNSIVAQGRPATDALPFYRRAVELDPQFAMAYDALGSTYFHLDEFDLSLQSFQKAMDLSGRVSEREKLILRAHYYGEGRVSLPLGLANYRLWATAYPYDGRPVVSLITLYVDIGQPLEGVPFGERALALQPDNALLYQALVRAYTHAGRFAEAKVLGARAVRLGKDNSHLHASLWQVAYAEHDAADLERERQWARSHADGWYSWFYPDLEAGAAASEGRIRESEEIYAKAVAVARQEGLEDLANNLLTDQAQTEAFLGELAKLRATLQRQTRPEVDLIPIARLRVSLGDIAFAEKVLEDESRRPNQGFFVTTTDLPCLRAAIALGRNRPLEAVAALDGTQQYDLNDHLMAFLRGQAYLKAGRPQEALVEYRRIVANPGQDPANPQQVLAHLGMARAYALGGDSAAARLEYESFVAWWKNADPDAALLKVVGAELAGLR